jgi:competence transcription factor ComK
MKKLPLIIEPDGNGGSILHHRNGRMDHIKESPISYIRTLCLNCGSTLEGRIDAFKEITATLQKACVLVSNATNEIYMPTLSMKNRDCIWILYNPVVKVVSAENGYSRILFTDRTDRTVSVSSHVVKSQVNRCDLFINKIMEFEMEE